MNNLINSVFNRTYNPTANQSVLSDIKRLLTSRDTEHQIRACGCLIEVFNRYGKESSANARLMEYLLDNDITMFLCEATSNLNFSLFTSVLSCLRLLWRERRFFAEEHAAHSMTAVLRALTHYAATDCQAAVIACLHFLCDLLSGISTFGTSSPLSHQSAYSADQLLACLNNLATRIKTNSSSILSSALVLNALISYQPESLVIKGCTATALLEVLNQWFVLLKSALNHSTLLGNGESGMIFGISCQLGNDVLKLIKLLRHGKQKVDFVQTILADEQEIGTLKQCASEMSNSAQGIMSELVVFAKDNQTQISTEEYGLFLMFLLHLLQESEKSEILIEFCDQLVVKGYLAVLPQAQIARNDVAIRNVSTLVLGEMLKMLAQKYLIVNTIEPNERCAEDIHMGLVELQNGMEKQQNIGMQLQKNQPYCLLIYIYFQCQAAENPDEAMAPLLPHLVKHILQLPKSYVPPLYIIKALWLVFAMSSLSNKSLVSLEERVHVEKATSRLVTMLYPEPSVYYTHHPALLLWIFTSERIPVHVRLEVLSQWFANDDSLPDGLTDKPEIWELLLNILIQGDRPEIVSNCKSTLHGCLDNADDDERQDFAELVFSKLSDLLLTAVIDCESGIHNNTCYLMDIAVALLPAEIDQVLCQKIAVLITTIFSKIAEHSAESLHSKYHFEYSGLILSRHLLEMTSDQNDHRVLLTFVNRVGFLPSVLKATNSLDDGVACAALQLLTYVIHYFTKNNYQPQSVLQIQTQQIIKSFRRDSSNDEIRDSLFQLLYTALDCGPNAPLMLSYDTGEPATAPQCNVLRALMFRIQCMLCSSESPSGWGALTSIFKYAIVSKNDPKLIATLTSQPWTLTLIRCKLTQNITEEFLIFTHYWLTLLTITIQQNRKEKRTQMTKHSLVVKMMTLMAKKLAGTQDGDFEELKEKIVVVVRDILRISNVKLT